MLLLSCYLAIVVPGSRTVLGMAIIAQLMLRGVVVISLAVVTWLAISVFIGMVSRLVLVSPNWVDFSFSTRLVDTCFLPSMVYQLVISSSRMVLFISRLVDTFISVFQAISRVLIVMSLGLVAAVLKLF